MYNPALWIISGFAILLVIIHVIKRNTMVDIKAIQNEIEAEMRDEEIKRAKSLLKDKAKQIANAERVVLNLRREYDDLIARIGEGSA